MDRDDVAFGLALLSLALQVADMWKDRKPRQPRKRRKRRGRHRK